MECGYTGAHPAGWTTHAPPEAFCAAMSSTVQTAISDWLGAATFCGSDGPPPTYAGFFWSTPLTCAPRLHAHGWHDADAWFTMVNAFEGMRRGQTDLDILGLAAASCGLGSKRGGGPELPRCAALRRSPWRRKTSGLPRRRGRSLQSQRACPIHESASFATRRRTKAGLVQELSFVA